MGNLGDPLLFQFSVFAISAPSVDPVLFLLVPDSLVTLLVLNAFGGSELLPFCWWFGFWQGL